MVAALELVIGLIALLVGAELVVRYGSVLARRLGVPPMIIGLTIVSIGTSAPELAVGIDAMNSDAGSLAIGNIAGTNIVNLLLILGLCALIRPVDFESRTLRLELPAMCVVAVLVLLFCLNGALDRWEGVPLVAAAIGYTWILGVAMRRSRRSTEDASELEAEVPGAEEDSKGGPGRVLLYVLLLLAGIAMIVKGADWLVSGAESLARMMGVSDAFIGLTIVAIGTSAPELFTALISTLRGDRDIAIGNLIGSSIYNLTLILGVPVLLANGSGPIDASLLRVDVPLMVLVCLACIPLFLTGRRLTRAEGGAMVAGYGVYFIYLLVTRT